jgi:hypothetical protein
MPLPPQNATHFNSVWYQANQSQLQGERIRILTMG